MASNVDAYTAYDLRVVVKMLQERCLFKAARWVSELLLSIPGHKRNQKVEPISTEIRYPGKDYIKSTHSSAPVQNSPHWPRLLVDDTSENSIFEEAESDKLTLARTWIEMHDYARASLILLPCRSLMALFLMLYAQYLSRVHRPEMYKDDFIHLLDHIQSTKDPWLLYMKALFLYAMDRRAEAIECCIQSIVHVPYNWAAWELLGECIRDVEELYAISYLLPLDREHVVRQLFHIKKVNDLQAGTERELSIAAKLLGPDYFPNNPWIYAQRGSILYHLHDLPSSKLEFEQMLAHDPWRIDNIDVYSFALHVTHSAQRLSRLSREYLLLSKDRPEVCCLVGNYFSLQGRNDLAIMYFSRAAQLNPNYLSAWTLLGHELIEQKNSHAAIDTYRRAIDISRDDFRAWYGLGQAYELLNMHQYALFYYQHATALSPYDMRMWLAQGQCYEEIGRYREALECYRRALIPANPHDDFVLLRLAKCHAELGEDADAIAYHRRVVEIGQANGRDVLTYAKSAIEVAEYQMRTQGGDLSLAKELLSVIASSNSEDVEQATNMLKSLRLQSAGKINPAQ